MRKTTLLVLVLLGAVAAPARAEKIDNPEYASWKSFKVGAAVTIEHVSKMAGAETRMVTTKTLKELTDKKAVVRSQTTLYVMGNEMKQPAQDEEIPAQLDIPGMPAGTPNPDVEMEKGEETLTVGGKQVDCTWVKTTMKAAGSTVVAKLWNSDAVPGGMVKMESTSSGAVSSVTTMTVTSFKTE